MKNVIASIRRQLLSISVVLLCAMPAIAMAQTPDRSTESFTLDHAMQYALDHYPTVRAALEQVNVSSAGVSVAKSAYLPRLDSLWQSNRATANNIFGQVLPQSVIPSMSGPALPDASSGSVWGSAAGALFSWEPMDFGLRRATVSAAEAAMTRARAGEALTRLEVQAGVAAAFLNAAGAQWTVTALQADLDRRDVLARTVHALVDNQLRPGADASRSDAEQAAARTRVIQARQAATLGQIAFARALGVSVGVEIDATPLVDRVPQDEIENAAVPHPLTQIRQAAVDAARAQESVLSRTDLPRLYLQSSVFARGSGANPNGQLDGSLAGLGPDRANWAAGVQIVFPNAFDYASLRARKVAAAAASRVESALFDEAVLTVTSEQQTAAAMVQAARAIAANTPLQLAAARQTESQARARYQAGLASIVEVADAQSLLAQAELQDQLARLDIWRALLAEAVAHGSVAPFLAVARPGGGVR